MNAAYQIIELRNSPRSVTNSQVGVSGGTSAQDGQVAKAGVDAVS